jgi:ADP-ribose pyrophosphatase YjhB (NUDIX family)
MQKIISNPVRVVALTLIEQDGKFLLIRESKAECRNTWFLPGGRARPEESVIQTAVREAREESGILAELTGLLYVDQRIGSAADGSANRIRFVFTGKPAGGMLKQTEDEHSICAEWFSETEIGNLELRSPFVRKIIGIRQENLSLLPISLVHVLSPEEVLRERP